MWSHRQYTVHVTIHCSILLLLLRYEVWVIHERGWDTALWTNGHQKGKEDWHWSHQNRCPRNYILHFTHFWHKLCNKCDCSIVSLYNISVWSFFLGWLCSTEPILGSHTLSCQTMTCLLSACQEGELTSVCMGLPWIQQKSSIIWSFLSFFFCCNTFWEGAETLIYCGLFIRLHCMRISKEDSEAMCLCSHSQNTMNLRNCFIDIWQS